MLIEVLPAAGRSCTRESHAKRDALRIRALERCVSCDAFRRALDYLVEIISSRCTPRPGRRGARGGGGGGRGARGGQLQSAIIPGVVRDCGTITPRLLMRSRSRRAFIAERLPRPRPSPRGSAGQQSGRQLRNGDGRLGIDQIIGPIAESFARASRDCHSTMREREREREGGGGDESSFGIYGLLVLARLADRSLERSLGLAVTRSTEPRPR